MMPNFTTPIDDYEVELQRLRAYLTGQALPGLVGFVALEDVAAEAVKIADDCIRELAK